jgi:hypothetical protein
LLNLLQRLIFLKRKQKRNKSSLIEKLNTANSQIKITAKNDFNLLICGNYFKI